MAQNSPNKHTKNTFFSFSVLLPSLLISLIFVYGFIGRTFQMSLLDWNSFVKFLQGEQNYVGLQNYLNLLQDPRFQADLLNVLYFTLFFILGAVSLGIVLAILLNRTSKFKQTFQTIFLFPMALSFVVTGTIWRWIFSPGTLPNNPQGINLLLQKIGLTNLQWSWFVSHKEVLGFNFALVAVIIAAIWQFSGYAMVIWLAGIKGIPKEIIEAARIDGASTWQLLTKILFPLLRPLTISIMIILAHISLKAFALVYSMTGSGPNNITDLPAIYMFETTFKGNQYSTGASIAIVMFVFIIIVIIPYLIKSFKEESQC